MTMSDITNIDRRESEMLAELADRRAALITRLSALVLVTFFPLPILGGFTSLLDGVLFSGVTVAWVYDFAQFVIAIAVARYYMSKVAELELGTALAREDQQS